MRGVWAVAACALAVTALAGCYEPYRVHVDGRALERSPVPWEETRHGMHSEGWLGPKTRETTYSHDPPGGGPPYPGVLQVFSLRESDTRSTADLERLARSLVQDAVEREDIVLHQAFEDEGRRTLDSGVQTRWFILEGTVRSQGDVFEEDTTVRILGEVGHDGRSDTSFMAIALAQVEESLNCPIIGPCQTREDLTTWIAIVGDPRGTVDNASHSEGLVHRLRTH